MITETQDQIRAAGPNDALDTDWVPEFGNGPFRPLGGYSQPDSPTLIDRDPISSGPAVDYVNRTTGSQAVPFGFEMPDPAGPGRLYVAGSVDYAGQLLNAVAYDLGDDVSGMRPVAEWAATR